MTESCFATSSLKTTLTEHSRTVNNESSLQPLEITTKPREMGFDSDFELYLPSSKAHEGRPGAIRALPARDDLTHTSCGTVQNMVMVAALCV